MTKEQLDTKIDEVESKIAILVTQIHLTETEVANASAEDLGELEERLEDELDYLTNLEDILGRITAIVK